MTGEPVYCHISEKNIAVLEQMGRKEGYGRHLVKTNRNYAGLVKLLSDSDIRHVVLNGIHDQFSASILIQSILMYENLPSTMNAYEKVSWIHKHLTCSKTQTHLMNCNQIEGCQ